MASRLGSPALSSIGRWWQVRHGATFAPLFHLAQQSGGALLGKLVRLGELAPPHQAEQGGFGHGHKRGRLFAVEVCGFD